VNQARTACQQCQGQRIVTCGGKVSDLFWANIADRDYNGYVPTDMGLGDDIDYISLDYCLACGQMQGSWPLKPTKLEQGKM